MQQNVWKKSSRSNGNGGNNCVEIMDTGIGIQVRNSKDPNSAVLTYTYAEWTAFIAGAQDGEFNIA